MCNLKVKVQQHKITEKMEMKMKKAIIGCGAIILLSLSSLNALAASARCEVVRIEGNVMTIECRQEPQGFAEGDAIKVKNVKKTRIEGC